MKKNNSKITDYQIINHKNPLSTAGEERVVGRSLDRVSLNRRSGEYKFSHYKEALDQVLVLREETQFSHYEDLSKLGRILSFEIGFTTHDGGMIVESQCFFDESDVPPIDTWFYLESKSNKNGIGLLYCWIPTSFEHIVEHTMKFDFFECCRWVK